MRHMGETHFRDFSQIKYLNIFFPFVLYSLLVFVCDIHHIVPFCLNFSQGKFKEKYCLTFDKVGPITATQKYSLLFKTASLSFKTKQKAWNLSKNCSI